MAARGIDLYYGELPPLTPVERRAAKRDHVKGRRHEATRLVAAGMLLLAEERQAAARRAARTSATVPTGHYGLRHLIAALRG